MTFTGGLAPGATAYFSLEGLAGSVLASPGVDLGTLDLDGYCRAIGLANAALSGPQQGPGAAYGNWTCVAGDGTPSPLDLQQACAWGYAQQPLMARPTDPNDAYTWRCYQVSPTYVAMGDSFQSGEGARGPDPENYHGTPVYDFHTDTSSDQCHRSHDAYAYQVAARYDMGQMAFVACSGARIADVDGGKGPRGGQPAASGEDPQIQHLGAGVRLITIGIGGNDTGFESVLTNCVLNPTIRLGYDACRDQDRSVQAAIATTAARLVRLYHKLAVAAPNARLVVVDYPRLFAANGAGGFGQCDHLNYGDQMWLNAKTDEFDDAITSSVARSGVAEAVRVDGAFSGHGLCEPNAYVNHLYLPGLKPQPESFHPNAAGQAALAEHVLAHLFHPGNLLTTVTVPLGATVNASTLLSAGAPGVTFSAQWPGSTVKMTLESPAGHVYRGANRRAGVRHATGATYETYGIRHPAAGRWTVHLYGAKVSAGGESVRVRVQRWPRTARGRLRIGRRARYRARTVRLRARCRDGTEGCSGTMTLRRCRGSGRRLARTGFGVPRGSRVTIPVGLSPQGRRAIVRRGQLQLCLALAQDGPLGQRGPHRRFRVTAVAVRRH